MMRIGEGLIQEMIDCPSKWRHGSGPHIPNTGTVNVVDETIRAARCLYCKRDIFANVSVPSPYDPVVDGFLIDMTMNMVWVAQPTFTVAEEPDVDDLG